MRLLKRIPRDYWWLTVLVIVLWPLPNFVNQFNLSLAILILFFAYLGAAWNILGGYAGQFSFGHAVFYGVGAYTSTMLLTTVGVTPWVGMIIGALLAGIFGLGIGYLTFRYGLRGPYFALAMFAFAEMTRLIANEVDFINGSVGIHLPLTKADSWLRLQFEQTPSGYYYAILILFAIGFAIKIGLVNSKMGYYFQAIREDEEAAGALGVDPMRTKMTAMFASAALTAIGGSFFAQYFLFVSPELVMGVPISIDILLAPIVGGMGTIWGPLVGSLFLTPLGELTRAFVRTPPEFLSFIEGRAGVDVMIFGAILVIVVLFMPDGLVGLGKRLWQRITRGNTMGGGRA